MFSFEKTVAELIKKIINKEIAEFPKPVVFLTGGRSASKLYKFLANDCPDLFKASTLYLGDERCVQSTDLSSNLGTISSSWSNIEACCLGFYYINGSALSEELEATRYSALLPKQINLILLSVGEDGHIASLFPFNKALYESKSDVMAVDVQIQPKKRITITPALISRARNVVVMAEGELKGRVLAESLNENLDNFIKYPVSLTRGSYWVLDQDAESAFFAQLKSSSRNLVNIITCATRQAQRRGCK